MLAEKILAYLPNGVEINDDGTHFTVSCFPELKFKTLWAMFRFVVMSGVYRER